LRHVYLSIGITRTIPSLSKTDTGGAIWLGNAAIVGVKPFPALAGIFREEAALPTNPDPPF
jgi:hypothetical protein